MGVGGAMLMLLPPEPLTLSGAGRASAKQGPSHPPVLLANPPPPQFSIPFLVILPSKVTVTTRRGRGQPRHFNFCRKGSGFPPPLK